MGVFGSSKILALALCMATTLATREKKQGIIDWDDMDMPEGDIGSGFGESLDFICDNFCPKTGTGCEAGGVTNEDLIAEVGALKELLSSQTAAIGALKQLVESKQSEGAGTGSDLVPIEYRPTYPVFLATSTYGSYQLTLDEARDVCAQQGATLATYNQMVVAFEQGLDMCSCGWIDEGYAMYAIWYSREGCVDKIGKGIRYNCTWQSRWNAWCFSKDKANKEA